MKSDEKTGFKRTKIGFLPQDWGVATLDQLICFTVDNRGKSAPTTEQGIALIATNCIKENSLFPAKENVRYVTKDVYENWFRGHPRPNDIIVVNKGSVRAGWVNLVPDPVDFCIAQDMVAIRPDKKKVYGFFLFAFMRSQFFKNQVESLNVGTLIPHLKKTYFPLLIVPVPPMNEQMAIGDFYYNLSKKVELNVKMNETLEAIGQEIFRQWFVDFEFPNEEGKPYKSSGGETVDSELGAIPKGWRVGVFGDIAGKVSEPVSRSDKPRYDKYVSLDDITRKRLFLVNYSPVSDVDSSIIRFEKGDVLFGAMRPYFHKVCIAPFTGITRTTTFVIRAKDPVYQSYVSFLCFEKSTVDYADSSSVGSTIPYARYEALKRMPILIPERKIAKQYQSFVGPFIEKAFCNSTEVITLSQVRKTLLPNLMSGKIRVPLTKDNGRSPNV